MINLDNYFSMHPAMESGINAVRWMILRYFKSHKSATFKTQLEICDELKKEFQLTGNNVCTQGAVSKALKKLQKEDLKIGEDIFNLLKSEGQYSLQKKEFSKLSTLFGIGKIFEKEEVYEISSCALAISFKEGEAENFKQKLIDIYPEDVFFKLLICDSTLIMMYNKKHSCYTDNIGEMKKFFKDRAKFLERVAEKKRREEAERKTAEKFKAQQRKFQEELKEGQKAVRI